MNTIVKLDEKAEYVKKYANYFRTFPRSMDVDEVINILDYTSNVYYKAARYIIDISKEINDMNTLEQVANDIENKADSVARIAYKKADSLDNSFR